MVRLTGRARCRGAVSGLTAVLKAAVRTDSLRCTSGEPSPCSETWRHCDEQSGRAWRPEVKGSANGGYLQLAELTRTRIGS
jgi:hypothetical protein